MPIPNSKLAKRRRYRRFLRFFHNEKPSAPVITHPYQYLIRFRTYQSFVKLLAYDYYNYLARLPITLPPFLPTFLSSRW